MTSKKSPGGVIAGRTADGRHRVLYRKDVGKDFNRGAVSKYQPHQGERERQRRLAKAAKQTERSST